MAPCLRSLSWAGPLPPNVFRFIARRESVRPSSRASPPPQWLCSSPPPGTRQWTTSPASSAVVSRWPSWQRSSCTRRSPPSCCLERSSRPASSRQQAQLLQPRFLGPQPQAAASWVGAWAGGAWGGLAGSQPEGRAAVGTRVRPDCHAGANAKWLLCSSPPAEWARYIVPANQQGLWQLAGQARVLSHGPDSSHSSQGVVDTGCGCRLFCWFNPARGYPSPETQDLCRGRAPEAVQALTLERGPPPLSSPLNVLTWGMHPRTLP